MEQPSLGSMIYMTEVPANGGGDTLFADSYCAYLGMPAAWKRKLRGVQALNDYRLFLRRDEELGVPQEVLDEMKKDIPFGVWHPLIRTHPETGQQALYLNGGFIRKNGWKDADGREWSKEETKQALEFMNLQHSRPDYQCRFHPSSSSSGTELVASGLRTQLRPERLDIKIAPAPELVGRDGA